MYKPNQYQDKLYAQILLCQSNMFRGKICDISQIDMAIKGEEPQSTSIIISHIYI